MDLKAYYDARVAQFGPEQHLEQVGHTVNGAPIPRAHLDALLAQIASLLALGSQDSLLDLCCGNGVLTSALAPRVRLVCGADLSDCMISVAQSAHSAPNLRYFSMDARNAAHLQDSAEAPFDKVLLYGAWQHFDAQTGREVLNGLARITAPQARILLGFVPDLALKDSFLDTPARRAAHAAHVASGTDMMGTWWNRDTLRALSEELGFTCSFSDLPADLDAARYRFNALLCRP
ncbi:class I SAM-dependent methyltransferase [uncultured Litoreibacter sp.]|uniref:class I SAM-dependent methyltransferase n=1 Tax=uncultured Litoreibacter sp. TaxID=1392394 RepID=UPI00262D64D3|nr:class I SAM-dependent methyltransferase [uncultured Litoreibacter sp.]